MVSNHLSHFLYSPDDPVVQTQAAYFDTERPDAEPVNEAGVLKSESATLFARHDPEPNSRVRYSYIPPSKLTINRSTIITRSPNWHNLATGQPDAPVRKLMAMPPPKPILLDPAEEARQNLNQMLHILHKPRRIYHW